MHIRLFYGCIGLFGGKIELSSGRPLCACRTSWGVKVNKTLLQGNQALCREYRAFAPEHRALLWEYRLFCGNIWLFCRNIGLLCGNVRLFCGNLGLCGQSSINVPLDEKVGCRCACTSQGVCANRALLWDYRVLLREYRALLRADVCVRLVHREVCM